MVSTKREGQPLKSRFNRNRHKTKKFHIYVKLFAVSAHKWSDKYRPFMVGQADGTACLLDPGELPITFSINRFPAAVFKYFSLSRPDAKSGESSW
jgi:hypothetical protein